MSNKTPTAVRVARWAAVAAAITGLCTIGNTFIEKRPWFLGGEDDKPAIVAAAPAPVKRLEHYEAPNTSEFRTRSASPVNSVKSSAVTEASVMSSVGTPGSVFNGVADRANSGTVASTVAPESVSYGAGGSPMAVMAGAPDMGWWRNTLNFMEYRPIAFWLMTGSSLFVLVFFIVEFFHRRKIKNKSGDTQWLIDNHELNGRDEQPPLK